MKRRLWFRLILILLKILGWIIFAILFLPVLFYIAPHAAKTALFHNEADAHKSFEPKSEDLSGRNFYLTSAHSLIPVWHLHLPNLQNKTSSELDALMSQNGTKILVYVHGNAVDRVSSSWALEKFVNLGWQVFAFDYSGYAENPLSTLGYRPPEELRIVHRWIKERSGENGVFWWCYSIGTGICSTAAVSLSSENIAPAGIVLESPFSSVPDLVKSLVAPEVLVTWVPLLGNAIESKFYRLFGGNYMVIDNLKKIPNIPVVHIHAEDDWLINISHFDKIKKAMEKQKRTAPYFPIRYKACRRLGHMINFKAAVELGPILENFYTNVTLMGNN